MATEASATAYRKARDTLVALAGQHDKAVEQFRWPDVGERFNWAIDWFDAIARGNQATALWIVEENGSELKLTFDEMARRSDQVAVWLAGLGVGKGDRVLLMLGNQVELWETMLAVFKLGGVIMPTTAALGPADLRDRVGRGGAGGGGQPGRRPEVRRGARRLPARVRRRCGRLGALRGCV